MDVIVVLEDIAIDAGLQQIAHQQRFEECTEQANLEVGEIGAQLAHRREGVELGSEYGFVFQQHFLINYLTALENVMVSAPVQDKAHAAQARALLADLGLGDKLHRFPYEISGGERQRLVIARAMIHRPRVIFADEPTGLLDRRTGLQVMALLRSYRQPLPEQV